MVVGLAFLATAVSSLFAQSTLVRYTQHRRPEYQAWTIALAMFALASAALATGASTGWDRGTFRAFYLLGAVANVPWLGLGTIFLLAGERWGRRVRVVVVLFTGFAAGVLVSAPMDAVQGTEIPVGKDVFGVLPRVLAAVGSSLGATVVFVGAALSMVRFARSRQPGSGRRAGANALIALGTLVLSSGGVLQGAIGHDDAFALSLALGISIIGSGFLLAARRPRETTRSGKEPR